MKDVCECYCFLNCVSTNLVDTHTSVIDIHV